MLTRIICMTNLHADGVEGFLQSMEWKFVRVGRAILLEQVNDHNGETLAHILKIGMAYTDSHIDGKSIIPSDELFLFENKYREE